jgi:predicted alpha/beta superfamily hydrolase
MFWTVSGSFHNQRNKSNFGFGKELEDLIIVSISDADFTFRYQDYTTSLSTSTDEKVNKRSDVPKGGLISGGADKFLTSMKTEIVPFVDKNYKTNSDRGIFGHSFGVCLQLIVW